MAHKEEKASAHSQPEIEGSSSSDEDFQDAVDHINIHEVHSRYPMDLTTSLEQCELALNKFLNNDLQGAMTIMRPWSRTSLYHSLATSIFEFIPAVLTLDPRQVEVALASIKDTLSLCQQYRRSYSLVESLGTIIRKPNFSTFTELEAHAELCYAETLLLQAALSLLEGEDLAGLVRATLKVKASHSSYKNCERILNQRRWVDGRSRRDFESGVRLGTATFNLVISMLPARLTLVLSYAGFSGDRAAGLAGLERGSLAGGLRAPLCDLTLLAVQLVVVHFVAGNSDMTLAERILATRLQQYPEGAFFLLFLGRLQLLRGNTSEALATYARVAAIPRLWPQLQQLTYWECMWACSIELRWREAAQYAGRLLSESAWSRTVYAYARAAFLLELSDLTPEEKLDVVQLLGRAATYRQRIAGKSLPMEKFVVRRCQHWAAYGKLVLPGLELLCLWNMFPALAANEGRVQAALQMINEAASQNGRHLAGSAQGARSRQAENNALIHYLRGALYVAGHRVPDALSSLDCVLELRNNIQEDTFLVPYTLFEIACCHITVGEHARGRNLLRDIRSQVRPLRGDSMPTSQYNLMRLQYLLGYKMWKRRNYSGYLLESRLQFRMHSRLEMIPEQPAEEERAMLEDEAENRMQQRGRQVQERGRL